MLVDDDGPGVWQLIRAVARYYSNRAIVAGIDRDWEGVRESLVRQERWSGYWYRGGPDLIYHVLAGAGDAIALGALVRLLPNPAWSDDELRWLQEYAARLAVRVEATQAHAQEEFVSIGLDSRNYLDRSLRFPDPEEKLGFRELNESNSKDSMRYQARLLVAVDGWLMLHQQLNTLRMFRASLTERETLKRRLAAVQRHVPASFFLTTEYGYKDVWVARGEASAANGRAVMIGVAVERFRRKYGKNPADVTALVPEFLSQVPRGLNGRDFEINFAPWQARASGKDFCVSGYQIKIPGPGQFRVKVAVIEKLEVRR